MKSFIILVISFSMWSGMPFTAAKNQLLDVTSAFRISSFPCRVGCDPAQMSITFVCGSIILFHLSSIVIPFPTQDPNVLIGSPSLISLTYSGILLVLVPRNLSVSTLSLYAGRPIGRASVFSMLKCAVDKHFAEQGYYIFQVTEFVI